MLQLHLKTVMYKVISEHVNFKSNQTHKNVTKNYIIYGMAVIVIIQYSAIRINMSVNSAIIVPTINLENSGFYGFD